jgi:hypothetical protein
MDPEVSPIRLPAAYGAGVRTLSWVDVSRRLTEATHYWLATTRPDGRPHTVPVDGVWLADGWYFGGHPDTVYQRNMRANPDAAVHLPDPVGVVIAEGRAEWVRPGPDEARDLTAASKGKYGYAPPPEAYTAGVWRLAPRRVLAWTNLGEDPTRFTFDRPAPSR